MPGATQPTPRAREGNRGTALTPARPAHTPDTGSSDKPLPDPATTLRPRPATQRLALPVPGAEPAIPRSLPPCRWRSRRSRCSARSEARTNDLEVRQDNGHTRPRGRPGAKVRRQSHSTRKPPHTPAKKTNGTLDDRTKRCSICAAIVLWCAAAACAQIRSSCRSGLHQRKPGFPAVGAVRRLAHVTGDSAVSVYVGAVG
jgi:hypothetical protein